MFCPKCGTQLEEGDLFCPNCGTRISAPAEPNNSIVNRNNAIEARAYEVSEKPFPFRNRPGIVKPKRRIDTKWIIGIALIVLVAAGAVAAVSLLGGKGSGKNTVVMLSDGQYIVTNNPAKEKKNIEMASAHNDYTYDNLVRFSPDGKYVYFYTKLEDYRGSLCKAEIGKLKKDSSKNDKYIETIASNAMPGLHMMRNGTLVYMAGENNLYYYDGKESIQIAKNIDDYWTDKDYRIVYSVSQTDEYDDYQSYALYGVDLNDIDNKFKMASDVSFTNYVEDFDRIVFGKYDAYDNSSLYMTAFGKEPEKLSNNGYIVLNKGDDFYYMDGTGRKLNLYDYVNDDAASDDYYYDDIRYELRSDENAVPVYNLYSYKKGAKQLVAENVLNAYGENGLIVYNTVDMINDKVSIYDVGDTYDVNRLFDINYEAANYILADEPDRKLKMSSRTADVLGLYNEDTWASFYVVGPRIYVTSGSGIFETAVNDGEIAGDKVITDEGNVMGTDDNSLYYNANGYDGSEAYFCDIYKVTDGEKVRLAQDVASSDLQLYEDGNLFAYTDYRYYGDQGSGELAIFNPAGEKKKVGDDVTQYVRVDKNKVLFISDDKLYLFDGKEKESLQNDVEQIWCKNYLKPTDTLIYGIGD